MRDLLSARSMAMGGAFRALGLGLESAVGNPAAMSLYQRYDVELTGAWNIADNVAWLGAGVMDSSTTRLAVAATYHLMAFGGIGDRTLGHLNTLAMSMPLLDNVFVGIAAHYLFASGALSANAVTGDAGIIVRLLDGLTVGISGNNLVDTSHAALAMYGTAEAAYSMGNLSLALDVRGDYRSNTSPLVGVNAGGEYIIGQFPVRAGWALDERGYQFISAGVGYMFEGGGLDLAYRHEITGIGQTVAVTIKLGN